MTTASELKLPPQSHRALLKAVARLAEQIGTHRGVMLVYPSPTSEARQLLQGNASLWLDYSSIAPVDPHQMEVQFLNRSRFQRLIDGSGQGHNAIEVLQLIDEYDPKHEVLVAVASSRVYLWSREQLRQSVAEIQVFEQELLHTHRMPTKGVSSAVIPEHTVERSDDALMAEPDSSEDS